MAESKDEVIAIIGTACRFPGSSNSPSKLWELLKSPRDLQQLVPADRFDSTAYYHPDANHHGTTDCRTSYFLDENIAEFDHGFFNILPTEAEAIDPQQRLLMETVYDSLCDGGLTMESLRGSQTAVFVGVMCDDWSQISNRDWDIMHTYTATGACRSIISNRISYFFDWHGPSMTIDTACSSSLVCVHQAVQALRSGESRVAIAAGTNLILSPGMYVAESKLNMLSPTGRSRMWDADADGYARGEGIAAVVLKPLSDAIRDGDSIECVIRGTGVNQDGRTAGLTMPSNIAQAELIRSTYARAGLNINDPKDRPQFFHAHGTGTPVGDPQESEAISRAFFDENNITDKLYVGSLKTVIGHTEGTAGLASLIGTAEALKHATIPPNMHFNTLSPRVAPFYTKLQVPTKAAPWPAVIPGQPRRASVNSFGFGGTNAHAILETWNVPVEHDTAGLSFTPLLISAASRNSLRVMLMELREFLRANPDTNLRDLAYTLHTRRSTLPFRQVVAGTDVNELAKRADEIIANDESKPNVRSFSTPVPKILGIFTGQGAQWPRMGANLLELSPFAAKVLDELDASLSSLPKAHCPNWSLKQQLLADKTQSRVAEAAISQPLCTAVQIVLVELLKLAGIQFYSVVGHSSGEIGAAYAAGFLSAADAIRIAYYRGLFATLAGAHGAKGGMLAVGTSLEDAGDFCKLELFEDRIEVAAHNSASSITMSGDEDAVEHAVVIFKDEGKFARQLKVDTAYHSKHMQPCTAPYLQALDACGITVHDGNGTNWYSSVTNGRIMTKADLSSQYWIDNMTQAVLFSPAVAAASTSTGLFDLALEVGPHPSLKAPTIDTVNQISGDRIPYTGLLSRGKHDVTEFAAALGHCWKTLGAGSVKFHDFETAVSGVHTHQKLIQNLPKYPFDHARSFMMLTRMSAPNARSPPHPLLGRRCVERETSEEVYWRNFLRLREIPWLEGHKIGDQIVFPATGYIAMAVEAMASLADGRSLGLIVLENLAIVRAMSFDETESGIECLMSLKIIHSTGEELSAEFTCCTGLPFENKSTMTINAKSIITVSFHEPAADTLPRVTTDDSSLADVEVDIEQFYTDLTQLGYNYSGAFRSVKSIRRRRDFATGLIEDESETNWADQLIIHPCWLDTAIQTGVAAYSSPQDGRLWTLHVPTGIPLIMINPFFTSLGSGRSKTLGYQSFARESRKTGIHCDIEVLAGNGETFVHMGALELRPFEPATADSDMVLFSHFHYKFAGPNGEAAVANDEAMSAWDIGVVLCVERMGVFYLRRLLREISREERENALPHYKRLLDWAEYMVDSVSSGKHPNLPKEAITDTVASIEALIQKFHRNSEVRLVKAVGENLVSEVRQGGSTLEHMMKDGVLATFYESAVGLDTANAWIGRMMGHIVHRYPHMRILEVGAGTGGTTSSVLQELGTSFSSYTYTDVSAGYFERAQKRFSKYGERLIFKTFDMEKSPIEQGYVEGTYDVVLASNVLHATGKLDKMMKNVRQLLKPGGFLLALEVFRNDFLGLGTAMGSLPGWWAGAEHDQRRKNGPALSASQWNSLLQKHGFSGIDTSTPPIHMLHPYFVFAAQAIDDRVQALRNPMATPSIDAVSKLVIVGSSTGISPLVRLVLGSTYSDVLCFESLEDLTEETLASGTTVLSLTDLDEPFLKNRSESKLRALRTTWRQSRTILWVSQGCRDDNPHAAMLLGLSRAMRFEYPNINLQMLNLDSILPETPSILAESLVRLEITGKWHREPQPGDMTLWSVEPELEIQDGHLLIPRVYPYKEANSRYNTYRRTVVKSIDPQEWPLSVEAKDDGVELSSISPLRVTPSWPPAEQPMKIRVSTSILQAIKIHNAGYFTVIFGVDMASGQNVVALTTSHESPALTLRRWALPVPPTTSPNVTLRLAADILAESIMELTTNSGVTLIHGADPILSETITEKASRSGARLLLSSSIKKDDANCIYIPSNVPTRLLLKQFPRDTSFFLNMLPTTNGKGVGDMIGKCLPAHVRQATAADFCRTEPHLYAGVSVHIISGALQSALHAVEATEYGSVGGDADAIPLGDVATRKVSVAPLALIDWNVPSVDISLQPIDTGSIFRGDGTYLLVGLSGQLGQSLCHWMVTHGARNVVLASRNPKPRPAYIPMMEGLGATVKFMSLDVTSRESLHSCYDEICRTLPPVIGVANGAMILEDQLFDNLTWESFNRQLAPKVDGSMFLDELFYTTDLEFFVMFTSLGNIIGNAGQGSYVAANQFMTALAAQRKKRGFAGSAMAISSLRGIGYVERSDTFEMNHFTKMGYRNISEQDYLQLFAEAILVGKPDNPENSEIVTGLSPTYYDESIQAQFRSDPKFGHFILERTDTQTSSANATNIPVRIRLAGAQNAEDVARAIKESFIERLKRILRIPEDETVNEHVTLVEQGVDSIMAVDVRTWFLRELDVDIPILKILSASATIPELVNDALQKLPATLAGLAALGADTTAAVEAPGQAQQLIEPTQPPSGPEPKLSDQESSRAATPPTSASERSGEVIPDNVERKKELSLSSTALRDGLVSQCSERVEPMSFGQSTFWFLHHYTSNQTAFNIAFMLKLTGPLRMYALESAVKRLGQRHESLRTRYFWSEDGTRAPMQGILSEPLMRLETLHLASEEDANRQYLSMIDHRWDLGDWQPVRIRLLVLPNSAHYLLLGTHHIALDGHSVNVFFMDLEALYENNPLAPLSSASQYRSFAARQRKLFESGGMDDSLQYYRSIIPPNPQPMDLLPLSQVTLRPTLDEYSTTESRFQLQPALATKLKQLARQHRATSFHLYLAALQGLLFRMLPDMDTLFIGITDANRLDKDFMGAVGLLFNLLPLRFDRPQASDNFCEAITGTRDKVYTAMEHSAVPIDVILNELNVPRSSSAAPIFQVLVDYRLVLQDRAQYVGCNMSDEQRRNSKTGYDIALEINENPSGSCDLTLRMQDAMYSQDNTELFMRSFVNVLEEVSRHSELNMAALPLWTTGDLDKAVAAGRGADMNLEWPSTISHQVDKIANQFPERDALKDGLGTSMCYKEMISRVDAIATALRNDGLAVGAVVGVFQTASADWICSLLGILKAGGIYLPLDLRNSLPRLKKIAAASKPSLILTDNGREHLVPKLDCADTKTLNVTNIGPAASATMSNMAVANSPAVLLFTSGSTGEPKGVVLSHRGLCGHFEVFYRASDIPAMAQFVLQQSSYSFDYSLNQTFAALAGGGCLVVAPDAARGDPQELAKIMAEQGITYTSGTPSEYEMWFRFASNELRRCKSWKMALFGGEPSTMSLVDGFLDLRLPKLRTFSDYGPAEITLSGAEGEVFLERGMTLPIPPGRMLPNHSACIVDRNLQPVPLGVSGEILLSGVGISLGYWNHGALTREKFIEHPFAKLHAHYAKNHWTHAYRSGDRGRLREDGTIYCAGRIDGDTQVKIRGFRVELGEIEAVILRETGNAVKSVVVTLRDGILAAHVVISSDAPISEREIVAKIRGGLSLPFYMYPAVVVALDHMPLTSHGKVDRRAIAALPLPESTTIGDVASSDFGPIESRLISLWTEILPQKPTGLSKATEFFQVGGNSLLLVQLQSVMRKEFGTAPRLVDLMNASTLDGMANHLHKIGRNAFISWEAETSLEPLLLEAAKLSRSDKTRSGRELCVLVTGATGHLGGHLLQVLVEEKTVSQVTCLVRDKSATSLRISSPKIVMVEGDVAQPNLGLSRAGLTKLSEETDAIIHCAANRNFWDAYQVTRTTNVQSVKTLARLATMGGSCLHILSSGAVGEYGEENGSEKLPPVDGSDGYVSGKWAAEQYLRNAFAAIGLSSTIHRPTATFGSSSREQVRTLAQNLVGFAAEVGQQPDFGNVRGVVDFAPAADIAKKITTSVLAEVSASRVAGVCVVEHPAQLRATTEDLAEYIAKMEGSSDFFKLPKMPLLQWFGAAKKAGFAQLVTAQQLEVAADGVKMVSRR